MQIIPIRSVANQQLRVILSSQECNIFLRKTINGIFFNLSVNTITYVSSVICRDLVPLMCREYLNFDGNFIFIDLYGNDDPMVEGLGTRWVLLYLEKEEYALLS